MRFGFIFYSFPPRFRPAWTRAIYYLARSCSLGRVTYSRDCVVEITSWGTGEYCVRRIFCWRGGKVSVVGWLADVAMAPHAYS